MKPFSTFLVGVLTLYLCLACSLDRTRHEEPSTKLSSNTSIIDIDCFPGAFTVNGKQWLLKDKIGEGAFGKVYTLADADGVEAEHLVAKVIYSADSDKIEAHLKEEYFLAKQFSSYYVPTEISGHYRFKNQFGALIYAGVLIKKRVLGVTLADLVGRAASKYLGRKEDVIRAVRTLDAFSEKLATRMTTQARQNVFLADLHPNNIMYDGDRWYIVDGTVMDSRHAVSNYLDHPGYTDYEAIALIMHLDDTKKSLDQRFFEGLIRVQLDESYKELMEIYLRATKS